MYRVVIVDDEEPVLDSFAYMLEKGGEDFSLCGKARSGAEAVRVVCEVKPDVVFMDIQMPGIDGIDAITEIRLQYPEIVFILATAYERFDIAQKAIPLGVFSYLVKPISRRAFLDELNRVKIHLDRMRQRATQQLQDIRLLQKTKTDVKEQLLGGLPWNDPSTEDWELFSRLFSLSGERGAVRLMEVRGASTDAARESIFAKLRAGIEFKFNCVHAIVAARQLLYFPEEQEMERIDRYLSRLCQELGHEAVAVGRGGVYHYAQLSRSFAEALEELTEGATEERSPANETQEMQEICAELLRSEFDEGRARFEDFSARVFRADSFEVAKAKMVAFFTLLWTGSMSRALAAPIVDFDPAEEIMRLRSPEEWRTWAADTLTSFERRLRQNRTKSLPVHLSKALSIIHRDYGRPIQLSAIAEECQITPSYLCRLFGEHLGTSFVEYVTRYRIGRATALLKEEGCSIKETSSLVGFQDPNYFSRIFRRYVGLSPSDLIRGRK